MVSYFTKSFHLEVLTPAECTASVDAVSVVFPAVDGQVGVLSGRAPLVAMLGAGLLIAELLSGAKHEFYVAGGFAHVRNDRMTILAEECIPIDQMDTEAIWDELQTARKMPAKTDEELAIRQRAVAAAKLKFAIA
ncbi:MAG: FoF1 ATP synthase subunit delta/epsilon, partial [Planctomycetota bacterium]